MDLLMWQIRKNCSLFITSGTLSQLTGNTSICNTSKIDFRRLEALFCGVWPSPDFSLLSSRISLQNRKKCRFEPTFKKACPARLSERKKPDFKRLSAGTGLTETAPKRTPPSQLHKRLEIMMPLEGRGFESLRLRQKSPVNSRVCWTFSFCWQDIALAKNLALFRLIFARLIEVVLSEKPYNIKAFLGALIFSRTKFTIPSLAFGVRKRKNIVHNIRRSDL